MSKIKYINGLKKAIEEKDLFELRHNHYELVHLCRKHLFENNKPILKEIDRDISSLLLRFYKTGKPEWPEADRMMGGLEVLRTFTGSRLHTETHNEIMEKVSKSDHDRKILINLPVSGSPVRSGELANITKLSQNSLTNRLPGLEKRGLITRNRNGKNSFIYLTPKGKFIAGKLTEKPVKIEINSSLQKFDDYFHKDKDPSVDNVEFWKPGSPVEDFKFHKSRSKEIDFPLEGTGSTSIH